MNCLIKIILTLPLIILSNFAFGQGNIWPLQKCIDKALENNIEIKISQLEIKRVQKNRNSVWNQLMPSVSFNGSQSYNFGSTIDPSTNGRVSSNIQYDNFYINASMNLIDFNSLANAQKSKIEIEKAKAEKEIIENEYKLQILDSYYQALFTQELLKIQKEQFKNALFNLDRISKEVEIGSKPKSDLYDFQLSFTQEEKQILETEQLLKTQKTQLFQLINAIENLTSDVILSPTYSILNTSNSSEILNPKIKFAELNYKSSLKELKIQRAYNLPLLSSFYSISSFYYKPLNQPNITIDNFKTQIANNKNQQLGVQLSLPLFNGFRNNKKIVVSKIESEKNKFLIEQEKQKIENQIYLEEQTKQNYLQLKTKLNETLQHSKASFTTSLAKFESGKIDAFTLLSVKNLVLSSSFEVLKNDLQIEYVDLKMNLIKNNQLN
jgi:outer membrane protein